MLKVYNTLSNKKEVFKPVKKGEVGIYTCGPTVYSFAHIGNFRSFIVADIIRRYLEYKNYRVKYVKNITDVGHLTEEDLEDKIISAAKKEKKTPQDIAVFYTKAFLEDEKKLNIKSADVYPRATKHIKEMIELIKILLKKGYAYEISDGIYFDVQKFKNYGKLSGNTLNKLKKGKRIESNPEKKHPADFALWKKAEPSHLMQWNSPWGKGYPGWHIECSVMAMKYLGKSSQGEYNRTIDIHTGGEDNIFPHHENEIAQSEAVSGKRFVKYWVHTRHLLVEGEKMAKSKGNFYTLRDLEKMGYSPLSFRFLILTTHYRKKQNFTFEELKQAERNLEKIRDFVKKISSIKKQALSKNKKRFAEILTLKTKKEFEKAMNDDFNTPKALAKLFYLINKANYLIDNKKISLTDAEDILKLLKNIDKVFGFIFSPVKKEKIPKEILELVKQREQYRKQKNWKKADEIRKKVKEKGYQIEDTKKGSVIKKLKF